MDSKYATIYHLPPLSTRLKQISWAQQVLEARGFKVKVVESRQLSSADRRALEQAGHAYPVVFIGGKFISMEQLESELDKMQVAPTPKTTPIKPQAPPIDFMNAASPPGPLNIFLPVNDGNSDSSSPRRFEPVEDSIDGSAEEEIAPTSSNRYSFGVFSSDPSPFDANGSLLEELDDEPLEIHDLAPRAGSFPNSSSSGATSSHNPPTPVTPGSTPSLPLVTGPLPTHHIEPKPATSSESEKSPPKAQDPRTAALIWLFNGIKQYCESAEFQRAINLLGKTADLVETKAKSFLSYFSWGGSSSTSANGSSPSSNSSIDALPTPPPDSELTLTLLVIRKNWYHRDQLRFLRLDSTGWVRLRPDDHSECERTSYEHLHAAQVTGSTIKFRYLGVDNKPSEIAYTFGDAEVARMIAEALNFLKGRGTVAVSYVGN